MAGFVAQNVLEGLVKTVKWPDVDNIDSSEVFLLDVRTPAECASGVMPGSVNIPLAELRQRLDEIPRDKKIILYCRVGLLSYPAARVLTANGFKNVLNLSGGYETWHVATTTHKAAETAPTQHTEHKVIPMVQPVNEAPTKIVEVNACGLQCPGPVMRLKQEMDVLQPGEALSITASDAGFYSDAPAWARSTGNVVRDISVQKGIVKAVIEKAGQEPAAVPATAGNDKTIIVFSGNLDKVIASFIIANGSLAMGRKVTLFFTFWGLNALRKPGKVKGLRKNLIEKAFGWMMPQGSRKLPLSNMNMGGMGSKMIRGIMQHHNVPALEEMIPMAIKGGVNLVACQMSMDLMGIRKEELIDGVQIGGVAAYLEASEHSDNNLFI
jgi:peroxiredoxin family protein/rhodanese-related sulfurtransferase/TusA-related sulfurtransferase